MLRCSGLRPPELLQRLQFNFPFLPRVSSSVTSTNKSALHLRHFLLELRVEGTDNTFNEIVVEQVLHPQRNQDYGNGLWEVFNRVQEKIVGGSFTYVNEEGKLRKARPIKNFQQDMALNGQLWEIAEQFIAA